MSCFSVYVINCLIPFFIKGSKRRKSFAKKYKVNTLKGRMEKVDDENDSRLRVLYNFWSYLNGMQEYLLMSPTWKMEVNIL